jgi:hypothetical protein
MLSAIRVAFIVVIVNPPVLPLAQPRRACR